MGTDHFDHSRAQTKYKLVKREEENKSNNLHIWRIMAIDIKLIIPEITTIRYQKDN